MFEKFILYKLTFVVDSENIGNIFIIQKILQAALMAQGFMADSYTLDRTMLPTKMPTTLTPTTSMPSNAPSFIGSTGTIEVVKAPVKNTVPTVYIFKLNNLFYSCKMS